MKNTAEDPIYQRLCEIVAAQWGAAMSLPKLTMPERDRWMEAFNAQYERGLRDGYASCGREFPFGGAAKINFTPAFRKQYATKRTRRA